MTSLSIKSYISIKLILDPNHGMSNKTKIKIIIQWNL